MESETSGGFCPAHIAIAGSIIPEAMKPCWSLFLLSCACLGQSTSLQSAREAYDIVNAHRAEARKLFQRGDNQGIEKGIQVLQEALLYLDRPLIRDLATGYVYLASRRANIYFDLAEAYGLQGKEHECLEYLRQCLVLGPDPKAAKYLDASRALNRLHDNPEFNEIVRRFREYEYFWDSKALSTVSREHPRCRKVGGFGQVLVGGQV